MSKNRGTASQQVSGWYVEFQAAVIRALPRDIDQDVADGWRENGETLAENLREMLIPAVERKELQNKILKLISGGKKLVIDAADGTEILAKANDVFAAGINSDFVAYGADEPGLATPETSAKVYEMAKDATFAQMFGSLESDLDKLCFTQAQIKGFMKKHRNWLRANNYATFFLFKSRNQFFVACADARLGGGLRVSVDRVDYSCVWDAGYRYRVVVP
ncbi:hypothetical protein A3J77_01165 [Candidatus Wolfebacteria bacterium RBG_13_41_7]|uniref:Uncharacterized protein n=1 Tax=Candidatus Wolfebacteria bacterium RBG_13_41_7 TaxID=1802554 RepID=A0A1F8DLT9_9BACT|nr:MAG: hypothetical protein A3J77_01165 [Candidatus Wolfebacteria bacterium RBG_13_41_7]